MAQMNDVAQTPPSPYENPSGQPAGGGVPPMGPGDREMSRDARMWAMFCHLAGLAFMLPIVPLVGGFVGSLILWVLKKDQYPFVDEQGKEAVNFQITMLIYSIVAAVLIVACIGAVLLPAVIIVDIVCVIIATVKVNDGYHYRYPCPLIIRFIK
jgi:uncharacterized Tic20 family protein